MSENLHLNESESTPKLEGELFEKWGDGIDERIRRPKPFDIRLQGFFSQEELGKFVEGKSPSEVAQITELNHQTMLQNDAEIDKLNQRIVEISEFSPDELESFYSDETTSDSDKSIVFCVETLRKLIGSGKESFSPDERELLDVINNTTTGLDGFWIFFNRESLKKQGSHFNILTQKEQEVTAPGSLEDIASAALEAFIMNPNYDNNRILDYDSYLHGIMLDCTKKIPGKGSESQEIIEEVDLEEFQERIIESMSWNVLDFIPDKDAYTESEIKAIKKQAASLQANYYTGHHFLTDREMHNPFVNQIGEDKPVNIYLTNDEEENIRFWQTFEQQIRKNNTETFEYDSRIAAIEMKTWAEKINLDEIEAINNNTSLSYEEKITRITANIQTAFDVQNLDENGVSQPIAVKWFRPKPGKIQSIIRNILNIEVPSDQQELPEDEAGAYYSDDEKAIYYRNSRKNMAKLSDWDITTVAHEMWHAKQHEIAGGEANRFLISNGNAKERMYQKNNLAYNDYRRQSTKKAYRIQIIEQEAYAVGDALGTRLYRRKKQQIGHRILGTLFAN